MPNVTLKATGVIVRNRSTGKDYGMHSECAERFMAFVIDQGYSVMDADIPVVIIGPMFAPESEWECAYHA